MTLTFENAVVLKRSTTSDSYNLSTIISVMILSIGWREIHCIFRAEHSKSFYSLHITHSTSLCWWLSTVQSSFCDEIIYTLTCLSVVFWNLCLLTSVHISSHPGRASFYKQDYSLAFDFSFGSSNFSVCDDVYIFKCSLVWAEFLPITSFPIITP